MRACLERMRSITEVWLSCQRTNAESAEIAEIAENSRICTALRALRALRSIVVGPASANRDADGRCGGGEPLQVGVDHHLDQLPEVDARRPSQLLARLRRIAEQVIHLRGPEQRRVLP